MAYIRRNVTDGVTIMNKDLYDNLQDGIDESKQELSKMGGTLEISDGSNTKENTVMTIDPNGGEEVNIYSAEEVDYKFEEHNVSDETHNDIRVLIKDLATQLSKFLNVDDTTRDQLSEVLTLIDNNKGTLESLTTSKINVADIIDNLTTSDATKVLSAKQGVVLKELIDAITIPTKLSAFTDDVGYSQNGHKHTTSEINDFPTTETWAFTLEDGSIVNKVVYVK